MPPRHPRDGGNGGGPPGRRSCSTSGRQAPGGRRSSRVYDHDGPRSELRQQYRNPPGSSLGDAEPEALVVHRATDGGDEVELSADLVAPEGTRLPLGEPVREELVGVLTAVGEPERDVRQVAQEGGREGTLA